MKVKVKKFIEHDKVWEIQDFFRTVSNFNKKFYTLDVYWVNEDEPILQYRAVAISRDLVYVVRWDVSGKKDESKAEYNSGEQFKRPPSGIMPDDDDITDYLFPRYNTDEEGCSTKYVDAFRYNEFTYVYKIDLVEDK